MIREELQDLKKKNARLPFAKRKYITELEVNFGAVIERAIPAVLKDKFSPNQQSKELARKLIIESLARQRLSSYRTGVVIVGFGDDEICPSLERFEIQAY